jgi:hypothetical protein
MKNYILYTWLADTMFKRLSCIDKHIAMQFIAACTFGLRVREAILLKPTKDFSKGALHLVRGTKGGATRIVPIETPRQRYVLNQLQAFAASNKGKLIEPGQKVDQAHRKFLYMLGCLDVPGTGSTTLPQGAINE